MRGFAITGREQFLAPLTEGERSFQQHLAQLRRLTADNPQQQQRLSQLQALYDQWAREDIHGNVELRRQVVAGAQSMEAVIEQISAGRDKAKMDAMRQLLADLKAEENALLAQRNLAMQVAKSSSLAILLIGGLIAVVLAISVAFALSRS
ncbi:CHASE3 domain-containing protein, partial [Staphylococcus haemolyticus]|uniref:CHASE3 domain-containing protein n=1 Tax=Staphylococcus haemolyticus TaxID=1283 RepID=UPI003989D960